MYKDALKLIADHLERNGFTLDSEYEKYNLMYDLGLDSMDLMELFIVIEKKYDKVIDIDDYKELNLDIIGNLAKYICNDSN